MVIDFSAADTKRFIAAFVDFWLVYDENHRLAPDLELAAKTLMKGCENNTSKQEELESRRLVQW